MIQMDIDLYKILGVDRGADKHEIKRAYRKWMNDHHPDKNGGMEHPDHESIQLAYETLMDNEKRAHYDETGMIMDNNPIHKSAMAKIATFLTQIMQTCDLDRVDLKVELVRKLQGDERHAKQFIKQAEKERAQVERVLKRAHAGEKTKFITGIMENVIAEVNANIKRAEHDMEVMACALQMLEDFDYEVMQGIPTDQPTAQPFIWPGQGGW